MNEEESRYRESTDLHPKVTATGAAGALAVVIAFALAQLGVELPEPVIAAITALLAFGAGYLVPSDRG